MLISYSGVLTCLQLIGITNMNGQMLTLHGVLHFEEIYFLQMNPDLHFIWQIAERAYTVCWVDKSFADDNVACGGGGVTVWAGIGYEQHTGVHFIDLNLQFESRQISWWDLMAQCSAIA